MLLNQFKKKWGMLNDDLNLNILKHIFKEEKNPFKIEK